MNYSRSSKGSNPISVRVMCAVVFIIFSFVWLYFFQADILTMTQHVLSGGLTHYHRFWGAVIITITLYLVQLLVYRIAHLKRLGHALTYGPSVLLLSMLTDIGQKLDTGVDIVASWHVMLVAFIVWVFIVCIALKLQEFEDDTPYALFSRPMWINMLTMSLMMMWVAWIGNTDAVFHYRMKMENLLSQGNYGHALAVGKKSLESDDHLFMLRMYALARTDGLGEHLFEYPVAGSSSLMLPSNGKTKMLVCPVDSLYRFLGARPVGQIEPVRYLKLLQRRDSVPRKVLADYLLCGELIDKDLDRFAKDIQDYYTVNDSLPKHYREALTLYSRLRSKPVVVYHHPVMDEDYDNLQELEKRYPSQTERKGKVEEHYRGTYWYYYWYE